MYLRASNVPEKLDYAFGHRAHPRSPSRRTDCRSTTTCRAQTTALDERNRYITLVLATSKYPRRSRLTHADPAELVLALLARHVVAAAVLLDRALALAALLRVALDPVRRLAVVPALLQPHLR